VKLENYFKEVSKKLWKELTTSSFRYFEEYDEASKNTAS
jgi:hypothetical protein